VKGFPVKFLIKEAYDNVTDNQIVGGPKWIATDRYDIQALPVESVKVGEYRDPGSELLREILADRFKLKFHREQRMLPVYLLTVAKDGPKLKVPNHKILNNTYDVTANQIQCRFPTQSISGFVHLLGAMHAVDRPVIDKTGITSEFDLDLKWTPDMTASSTADNSDVPSLFTALKEQLGLELKLGKAMVEVMVIDHIEPPSPN